MKVIKFQPGLIPVLKHQEHDQASHGNWADGSQGSATELSDNEISDIISGSNTVNEMYQKVAERLGKSMKPKLEDLSEEEINFYRGVTDVNIQAQSLLNGEIRFTPFQTWGQGIYISSEPEYASAYGDLIGLKLDKSVKLVEGEIAWTKAYSLFDKETSLDMPKILDRITSGKMDNFSDSDIANLYWAAKGYDGYSVYKTGRAEVVLFNADKLTVNRADIGEAVRKHLPGGHDQKDHGSWATGGGIGYLSESTAKEIEESKALFQEIMGADNDLKETLIGYGYQGDVDYEKLHDRLARRYMDTGMGKNTAILQARIDMGRVAYAMKNAEEEAYYQEVIKKNRESQAAQISEYAEENGQTADAMEEGLAFAESKILSTIKNGNVTIAVSEEVLSSVLEDGRYKNQFETRTSGGKLDVGVRKVGEGLATGTPAGTKLSERPVYGFLTDNEEVHTYDSKTATTFALEGTWSEKHALRRSLDWQDLTSLNTDKADQYGEIRFILKPEVRSRTTATIGDSLRTGVMADGLTNPKPDLVNMGLYKTGAVHHMAGNPTADYIETQIHGGVKVSDIDRIYVPAGRVDAVRAMVEAKGLNIPVLPRAGS
jgi:hypothetical protein